MTNKEQAAALDIEKIDDAYEIVNHYPQIGPYDTKQEARDILKSTRDFYLHHCPVSPMLDALDDILRE